MKNTWFIGDTHFGHNKILEYESAHRPFKYVEEMNEAIIARWNSVVSPGDTVYHLGDFCFGRTNLHLAGRLQGKKILILGNHDCYPVAEYGIYFDKILGCFSWKSCILTHIPVVLGQNYRYKLNIHGHLHSKLIAHPWYFNVSCEQNNLTPIHADLIFERIKKEV